MYKIALTSIAVALTLVCKTTAIAQSESETEDKDQTLVCDCEAPLGTYCQIICLKSGSPFGPGNSFTYQPKSQSPAWDQWDTPNGQDPILQPNIGDGPNMKFEWNT